MEALISDDHENHIGSICDLVIHDFNPSSNSSKFEKEEMTHFQVLLMFGLFGAIENFPAEKKS
jgi:hypothetical protein